MILQQIYPGNGISNFVRIVQILQNNILVLFFRHSVYCHILVIRLWQKTEN